MKNSQRTAGVVTFLSVLTFVMGAVDIISAVTPAIPERVMILRPVFPYILRSTVRLGTALIGFALIFLSDGIMRRKQVAWAASVTAISASLVFHLIKGLDIEEATISAALLVALLYERENFLARPDVPSLIQGVKALLLAFLFTIFYGTVGLYIMSRSGQQRFTLTHSFLTIVNTFFFIQPAPIFNNFVTSAFFDSFYLIGFVSIIFVLYMFFRPVIYRFETGDEDVKRARNLFNKFGKNYAAEIMLLSGKYYFFNSENSGFVVYKPVGSYAVVMTEPICKPEDKIKNTEEFIKFCRIQGWAPIFGGVSKEFVEKVKSIGLKGISIGSVAMINLDSYNFEGPKKKPLRYSVSIMERLGYSFRVNSPPISNNEFSGFRKTSNYWLIHEKGKEMHFLVGYMDKNYIENNMVAAVYDKNSRNVAFANFYEYGDGDLTIDLMRHGDVPPDTMLYLFTKLIIWAKEKGYKRINLGMAILYGLGGEGSSTEEKALKVVFDRFNRLYNFRGLYVFKSKFQPNWELTYAVYPSPLNLTGALITLIRLN